MKNSGYTLVELMIVVAIIGTVALVAPRMVIQTVKAYQLHNAKLEIQRDARVCLDNMNRFLRQAQASTIVIDQASSQPPYSRISFTTIDGKTLTFYQSGNKLFGGDSTSADYLSGNLRYLAFTYPRTDDPSIISVALTMEKATYEGGLKALELSIEKVRIMN